MRNQLFYGDNLDVLQKHVASESVDLVYLDPPFNSNRDFNVLFREQGGEGSQAQIKAFTDTWQWSERTYDDFIMKCGFNNLVELMHGFVNTLGRNDVTAYLVMMAPRILELHRVLKPTGSLYLHCDPTASHYLKLILDSVFNVKNFRNEISWKRSSAHSDTKQGMRRCGRIRDVIFFYTKSNDYTWNPQYMEYRAEYVTSEYRHVAPDGRHYKEADLTAAKPGGDTEYEWRVKRRIGIKERWEADLEDEYLTPQDGWEYRGVRPYNGRYWAYSKEHLIEFAEQKLLIHRETGMPRLMLFHEEMFGVGLQDSWDDITPASGKESLGYPTQKPLALLERIIKASSNEGDVVLDPFCGCGTAVVASQKLRRKWVGIDITHLAVALIKYRVTDMYGLIEKQDYEVHGEPTTEAEARALSLNDPLRKEFEKWAVSLIPRARPSNDGKKGADGGIDGVLFFRDDLTSPKKVVIQVKSGKVGSPQINQLRGTVEREKATLGLFVSLEPPTSVMIRDAESFGFYTSNGVRIPRLQIRTVAQLLRGEAFTMPYAATVYGVQSAGAGQGSLDI